MLNSSQAQNSVKILTETKNSTSVTKVEDAGNAGNVEWAVKFTDKFAFHRKNP